MLLKKQFAKICAVSLLFAFTPTGTVYAHGGGLDKNGCHKNSKTGQRHCHRKQSKPNPGTSKLVGKTKDRSGNMYYQNCTAARNASAAPIRRGQPGYGTHLDRDSDGIACE